jgi:hypothetical protein
MTIFVNEARQLLDDLRDIDCRLHEGALGETFNDWLARRRADSAIVRELAERAEDDAEFNRQMSEEEERGRDHKLMRELFLHVVCKQPIPDTLEELIWDRIHQEEDRRRERCKRVAEPNSAIVRELAERAEADDEKGRLMWEEEERSRDHRLLRELFFHVHRKQPIPSALYELLWERIRGEEDRRRERRKRAAEAK